MGTTREIIHELKITHLVDQAALTTTQTLGPIDTAGWESLLVVWDVGLWTAGTFTPKLTECATSGGSYTDVDASQVEFYNNGAASTAALCVVSSTATDQVVIAMSLRGGLLRYIKPVFTSASGSVTFGVLSVQGDPRETI